MFSLLQIVATAAALLALIPYFGWGIYTLRRRFRYHDELNPSIEIITLTIVVVFYLCEWQLLKLWMGGAPVYMIFAALGLLASGAALYGPMLISLTSHILVDMIMPAGEPEAAHPQYGPAEALERQGDYEGALQEYYVIIRIFPKDPTTAIRIGDNLMKLGRAKEATPWLERGLDTLNSAQKSLPIMNRLVEIYMKQLDRPQDAQQLLEDYLRRYPQAEYADSVRKRLERLKGRQAIPDATEI